MARAGFFADSELADCWGLGNSSDHPAPATAPLWTPRRSCFRISPMIVRAAESCPQHDTATNSRIAEDDMLIPMADVPRWYAERKPKDTIAIRHGADTLTWEQLECGANRRARAFAASGVKPGDFVAIGLPNGNAFFETTFAVWKLGATPTSLSWRLPRGEAAAVLDILKPAIVVGREADRNAPPSLPANFTTDGISHEPLTAPAAPHWTAM